MISKHRIGFDLDEPVRFVGMTKDEVILFLAGLVSFMMLSNKLMGSLILGISMVLLIALKRFKKRTVDFNIRSFVWWKLGINRGSSTLPPSCTRRIH